MESSWRWNVPFFGQAYGAVRLLARLVVNPDWYLSDNLQGTDTPLLYTRVAGFVQEVVPLFSVPKLVPGSNFPYGYAVEPDH